MKKFLIFISFLLLSTSSFGVNPALFLHQNFWLVKKIMSSLQQNNFQTNTLATNIKQDNNSSPDKKQNNIETQNETINDNVNKEKNKSLLIGIVTGVGIGVGFTAVAFVSFITSIIMSI